MNVPLAGVGHVYLRSIAQAAAKISIRSRWSSVKASYANRLSFTAMEGYQRLKIAPT